MLKKFCVLILLLLAPAPDFAGAGKWNGLNDTQGDKLAKSWQVFTPEALTEIALAGDRLARLDGTESGPVVSLGGKNYAALVVRLRPENGSYIYAPFAEEISGEDLKEIQNLFIPTTIGLLDESKKKPAGYFILYPPGALKYDSFADARLPVYADSADFLIFLPQSSLERALSLEIETLVCSETSCLPLKQNFPLPFKEMAAPDRQLPPEILGTLGGYRILQEDKPKSGHPEFRAWPDENGGQTLSFGFTGGHGRDFAGESAANGLTGKVSALPLFSDILKPVTFQKGLEVESLGKAMLFGLLAGFILNFMPCVLPVIGLKLGRLAGLGGWRSLSGGSEDASGARKRFRTYTFCFSLGALVWFSVLFAVIGWANLMWGQLFQSQTLIMILVFVLFILSLGLFGLYKLPALEMREKAASTIRRQGFFDGLLVTLLATPCSGPLLGGVLAWAVSQPLPCLGATLLCVGLGLAMPFILLSIWPNLARLLPEPGPWSVALEKIMGFVLLAAAIYLLSMLPAGKITVVLASLLLIAFCLWLWAQGKKTGRLLRMRSFIFRGLALGLACFAVYSAFHARPSTDGTYWRPFESKLFLSRLGSEQMVIDFTADWCINCRVLEHTTLAPENLDRWNSSYGLTFVKVDLTNSNPRGEELLSALGGAGIPFLAIFPSGESAFKPVVLRDLITTEQMDQALERTVRRQP